MSPAIHGLRVITLAFVAALGLMVLNTPASYASGDFLFNGDPAAVLGIGNQLGEAPGTFSVEQASVTRYYIPSLKFEIVCKKLVSDDGLIWLNVAHATLLFSECEFFAIKNYINHSFELGVKLNCNLKELGFRADVVGLPILHGGKLYVLFSPLNGPAFTLISIKSGEGCVLPLNNVITGHIVAQAPDSAAVKPHLTFSGAVSLLFGGGLKFGSGAVETFIDSLRIVTLTGPLVNHTLKAE